jgi:hypothetical protein
MKYIFANYPTEKHMLKIGNDSLEIVNGIAEVDNLNPAQVTLAEIYGGKPSPDNIFAEQVTHRKQSKAATTFFQPKKVFAAAMQRLNNRVKNVAKWSNS